MKKIAIFIPVYNESEVLFSVLSKIPKEILGYKTELVIVDDNSDDNSVAIAKEFTSHVIVLPENSGVGVATKEGFKYIANKNDYEFIIKFDGDGQHDISFLYKIVNKLQKGNNIVICSRFHPLSDQSYTPVDRILLNMIFTEMLRKITGWKLTDVRSGFMGFQFCDIKKIAEKIIIPRYGIPMEILLRIWNFKPDANIYELPHPAIYGGNISNRLFQKYSTEILSQKGDRVQMAYASLLSVVEDLQIPREKILEMNGFAI